MTELNELKIFEYYTKLLQEEAVKDTDLKNNWKSNLKSLINTTGLWRHLSESLDYWSPEAIVEVELTDKKIGGYSTYQHAYEKGDYGKLYIKQKCEMRGVSHEYVYQVTGYLGDNYSGFLLLPLNDGRYFKISYSC